MTQLMGRMTKNAVVNKVPNGREVVNFTVAVNDWYKPKNSSEAVKTTAYVSCAFWMNTKIAEQLKKSCIVEVTGRIYVTAYTDMDGTARASLNCHVNFIKIHYTPKSGDTTGAPALPGDTESAGNAEPIDDLPF